MNILDKINQYWGWSGLQGVEIAGRNEFGNFLVLDKNWVCWRVCPEELACEIVARSSEEYLQLIENESFQLDWQMERLVESARRSLGGLKVGWVYYLVVPGALGGQYEVSNIRSVPVEQLIEFAGEWALAVRDLPEGAQIRLRLIE